jgi:hypothetical protein
MFGSCVMLNIRLATLNEKNSYMLTVILFVRHLLAVLG